MPALMIYGLWIFFTTGALAAPSISLDPYSPNDANRKSQSKGGLVTGVDQIVLRATVNRNKEPSNQYTDTSIYIQATTDPSNPGGWTQQLDCTPDLSDCGSNQNGCYCESSPPNLEDGDFSLVFTFDAFVQYEGGGVRVIWADVLNPPLFTSGNTVSYPSVVCEVVVLSLTTAANGAQSSQVLSPGENTTITYSADLTQLEFCANGLKSPNFVRISKGSTVIIETTQGTQTCVSVDPSTNADITFGTVLTLAFQESDTAGCGREGSFTLVFSEKEPTASSSTESDKDDDCGSIPCWLLAIIIIIIIIAIIFFVCCVCFGFLCCKRCNKKCPGRDEEDCYFFCCRSCVPKDEEKRNKIAPREHPDAKRHDREYYDNKSYKCLKCFFCCLGPSPKQEADLERQLKELKELKETIETDIKYEQEKISSLQGKVRQVETRLFELKEAMETNSSENGREKLATLQGKIRQMETRLNVLERAMETNSSETGREKLATFQREIRQVETRLFELKEAMETNSSETGREKLATFQREIRQMETWLNVLERAMETNSSENWLEVVAILKEKNIIRQMETRPNELKRAMETNSSENVREKLATFQREIIEIETQLAKLKNETNSSETGQEKLATLQREMKIRQVEIRLIVLKGEMETNSSKKGQEKLATLQKAIIEIETQLAKLKKANGRHGTKTEKQKQNDKQAQQNSQNQASETQGSRKGEKPNEGTTTL